MTNEQLKVLVNTLEHLDELSQEETEKMTASVNDAINQYSDLINFLTGVNYALTLSKNKTIAEQAKERLKRCTQIHKEIDTEGQEVTLKTLLNALIHKLPSEVINTMIAETKQALKDDEARKIVAQAAKLAAQSRNDLQSDIVEDFKELATNPNILNVLRKPLEEVYQTRDKINNTIWGNFNIIPDTQTHIRMENSDDERKGIEITAYYLINWLELNDIEAVKTLTGYDKLIHDVIGTISIKGYNAVSIRQIFNAMGNHGKPSPNQANKIKASLRKMACAHIKFDNKEEAGRYNYQTWEYEGQLLNIEMITGYVGGQKTTLVYILRTPVLMEFAKSRKHCNTLPIKLLQSPISQTEKQLAIQNYLLYRIEQIKAHRGKPAILLDTVYKRLGITGAKAQYDARETFKTLLEFYKQCSTTGDESKGYISDYTMDGKRIEITI